MFDAFMFEDVAELSGKTELCPFVRFRMCARLHLSLRGSETQPSNAHVASPNLEHPKRASAEVVRASLWNADPRHHLVVPEAYPSLGIGSDRPSQYQKGWRAAMKGGARQNSDHAPIMKLRFDRGTILLTDPSKDLKLAEAPGVLWDPRVNAHRAPASKYPALKRWLLERGARFVDITTPPRPMQEAWSDVDLRSYQEAALSAWELGHRRGVVALPTGSGKTRLALAAMHRTRLSALCLLIVDEVHHFGSGLRDEALEMTLAEARLGLTATPPRDAGAVARLAELMGPTVFELAVADLAGGFLASFDAITLYLDLTPAERSEYMSLATVFNGVYADFRRIAPDASWADFNYHSTRTAEGRRALSSWRQMRRPSPKTIMSSSGSSMPTTS